MFIYESFHQALPSFKLEIRLWVERIFMYYRPHMTCENVGSLILLRTIIYGKTRNFMNAR